MALLDKPEQFLTTLLVGNNIAVITASSLMAYYLQPHLNGFMITLVSAVLLLVFGEILPKTFCYDRATRLSLYVSDILNGFYWLLFPVIKLVMFLARAVLSIFGIEKDNVKTFYTRKDLELLIREVERTGGVNRDESDMISRFLLKGRQKVREIMIPRTEIEALSLNESVQKATRMFLKNGHSRMPVFEEDIDHITGMITAKDLILEKPESLKDIVRQIVHVPEAGQTDDLLREMRKKGLWIAIVVGEYGGTAGMVTMEDIVEEFFGEIHDEHDEKPAFYRNRTDTSFEVKARADIDDINEQLNLVLPAGEYQTLGGLLINRLESIPQKGESLDLDRYILTVQTATRKKIGWVKIEKKNPK